RIAADGAGSDRAADRAPPRSGPAAQARRSPRARPAASRARWRPRARSSALPPPRPARPGTPPSWPARHAPNPPSCDASPSVVSVRPTAAASGRDGAGRRRHEFRADRIGNVLVQDSFDLGFGGTIEPPARNLVDRLQLVGTPRAPQRGGDALIEHPAHRQRDDAFAEALLRE